jgi:hypothetical protein
LLSCLREYVYIVLMSDEHSELPSAQPAKLVIAFKWC